MADDNDDLYDTVSAMADRLRLDGKDRERYIHEHMTRGGYRAVPSYVREEEDDRDDRDSGSSFFGSRDRDRGGRDRDRDSGTRRSRGRDDRRDRDRGDNWYD